MNIRDPFQLRQRPALSILLSGHASLAATAFTRQVLASSARTLEKTLEKSLQSGARALESSKVALENGRLAIEEAVETSKAAVGIAEDPVGRSKRDADCEAVIQPEDEGDMAAFSIPRNVPSFNDPQRQLENRVWGVQQPQKPVNGYGYPASNGALGNGSGIMGAMFEKPGGDLPMYKDKPYSYASSRRSRPFWRKKRMLGALASLVLVVFWLLGVFGHGEADRKAMDTAKDRLGWLLKSEPKGGADWLERRERVKEAFTLSWDAYERYAWGTLYTTASWI